MAKGKRINDRFGITGGTILEKDKEKSKEHGKTRFIVIREFSGSRSRSEVFEEIIGQCIMRELEERRLGKAG